MNVFVPFDLADLPAVKAQCNALVDLSKALAGSSGSDAADEKPAPAKSTSSKPAAKAKADKAPDISKDDVIAKLKELADHHGGDKTRAIEILKDIGESPSIKSLEPSKYGPVIDAIDEALAEEASGDDGGEASF